MLSTLCPFRVRPITPVGSVGTRRPNRPNRRPFGVVRFRHFDRRRRSRCAGYRCRRCTRRCTVRYRQLGYEPRKVEITRPDGSVGTVEGITHDVFDDVIAWLLAGENVWLKGAAGSGQINPCVASVRSVGRALQIRQCDNRRVRPIDGIPYRRRNRYPNRFS